MDLDSKRLFDGMKESLGYDFLEELKKELDEPNARVVADMPLSQKVIGLPLHS